MKKYDAAFVPCKERDVSTRKFPDHHLNALKEARRLLDEGLVRYIVPSGGNPRWHGDCGVTTGFDPECDGSADILINELRCPPGAILTDPLAYNNITNLVFSGRDVFDQKPDIQSVLLLAADERLPRFEYLGPAILAGVVDLDFRSVGPTNDIALNRNEEFAGAMQREFALVGVPQGRAGWDVLSRSAYEGELLQPFWLGYDAAKHDLSPQPEPRRIIAHMQPELYGVQPIVMDFATATAESLVLSSYL